MSTPENKAKLEKIPGYRQSDTPSERCDNCAFIKYAGSSNSEFNRLQGWCKMFRAYVSRSAVCDEWKEKPKSNRSYYVKRGSR